MQKNEKSTTFRIGSKTYSISHLSEHLEELFSIHYNVTEIRLSFSQIMFQLAQGEPLSDELKLALGNLETLDRFLNFIQTDLKEVEA